MRRISIALLVTAAACLPDPDEFDDPPPRAQAAPPAQSETPPPGPQDAGQAPKDAGTTTPAVDAGAPPPASNAVIVDAQFPAGITCGATAQASVTVRNTGTAEWSRAGGYKLGTVGDSDPLYKLDTRVWLAETVRVAPGAQHRFEIQLQAPAQAGSLVTDWQMVHEGVEWFGEQVARTVAVTCPPPATNRTPDPAPGQKLPLPNAFQLIQQVHNANPQLIAESCQSTGGNWKFMDAVVDRLRLVDTRWGYNWKRGVVGDPSQDVIDYHYSAGPDEGSTDVYIIDIIGGHCGTNPQPAYNDVTQATLNAGTIGKWTGRGRF